MRLAVISDIHSNLYAFNLALANLKEENIDKICFLGDYITDGENENEILHMIKKVADYTILGNREKYMLDYSKEKKEYNNYKTIHTTYTNLSKENLEYLKSLEEHLTTEIGNFKILMIHGNQYFNDLENIENAFDRIIEDFDFDICLFGHTHRYLYRKYKNKHFINPGSISVPSDSPTYKYCVVDVNEEVEVHLKEFDVSDSFEELASNYKKTEYYKNNYVWGNLTIYTIRDGIDYCSQFINRFNNRIKDLGELDAKEFNKIWDETFEDFIKEYDLRL